MAVFSKISIYFFESPLFVVEMILTAFVLFTIYGMAGYTLFASSSFVTNITHRTIKGGLLLMTLLQYEMPYSKAHSSN
jgi:hypothetical protein